MPDLETRLRTALHAVDPDVATDDDAWAALAVRLHGGPVIAPDAEPATPDWSATHPELVVDAGDPDVPAPPARSRRRLAVAIGVAAAIATGGLLATSPLRQSANGPATAPPGAIPRLVLDHPPAGIRVWEAQDQNVGRSGGTYLVGMRSTTGSRASVQVSATARSGDLPAGDPVTIDGHPGTFAPEPAPSIETRVTWNDGAVTYEVVATDPQMADPALALAVARSVTRSGPLDPGQPRFTLSNVPDGFRVTYEGDDAALYPFGGYKVHYGPSGEVPPNAAPHLVLHVWPRGLGADRLADILGLDPVTVAGRPTYVGPVGFDASAGLGETDSVMAVFELGGAVVRADASYLSRAQLLDGLVSLRIVSDADWRRLVLDRATGPGSIDVGSSSTVHPTVPVDAGSTSAPGPTTSLEVSAVVIPNLTGLRDEEATVALQAANLAQVVPTDCPTADVPAGLVVSQDPRPGRRVPVMTPVALCIARPLPHLP